MNSINLFSLAAAAMPLAATAFAQSPTPDSPSTAAAADAPAYVHVHDADKDVDQAVHRAQDTLAEFTKALTAPQPGQTGFAVKKRCIEGDKCEHIWLADAHFEGKLLCGTVDNIPVDLKKIREGQKVTVRPEEISDWMYLQDGRLVGGYTIVAYYRKLSPAEKKRFTQRVGFQVE